MILLFIGPSGSGKDTQADLLNRDYLYSRVSTGELIRDISTGDQEMQKVIRSAMNEGFLSDNFVFGLLQMYLNHFKFEKIILSGVVRRYTQIDLLDFSLGKIERKLEKVIYFNLSDEESIKRMSGRVVCPVDETNYNLITNPPKVYMRCDKCGAELIRREDDNEVSVRKRLYDFHRDNDEIIEEYKKRNMLINIDASKNIEEIYIDIKRELALSNNF